MGFGAVPAGHGHHEGRQDNPASERGDDGSHVSIVGVICVKAP